MIAKYFRFIDDDGKPSGWFGLAVAHDKIGLFHQIDYHGDPYCCELASVGYGSSVCVEMEIDNEYGRDIFVTCDKKAEFNDESMPFKEEGKQWKKPNWPDYEKLWGR